MANPFELADTFQTPKKLSVAETLQLARARKQEAKEPVVEANEQKVFTANIWGDQPVAEETKKGGKSDITALIRELRLVESSYTTNYSFHVTIWTALKKLCESHTFLAELLSLAREYENDLSREYFEYQTRNGMLNEMDVLNLTRKIIDNQIGELQNKLHGIDTKIVLKGREGRSGSKGSSTINTIAKAYQDVKTKMHQSPATVGSIVGMKESNLGNKAQLNKTQSKQLPRSAGAASAALVGKDL